MRSRQLVAAEQRASDSANRGIGNQAKVQEWQRRQETRDQIEAKGGAVAANDNPLRVSTWYRPGVPNLFAVMCSLASFHIIMYPLQMNYNKMPKLY